MDKLKSFRQSLKLTPKEMAATIGVSEWSYYKIEAGQRKPSYNFMKKFKKAFDTSVDEIFF